MNTNSYKPKKTAMEAMNAMQSVSQASGKSIQEIALDMGYSCGYAWLKALMSGAI